jgi:hypothetical protein
MRELIGLIATGAAAALGFIQSRRFVRGRLAYVDAVRRPSTPWLVGIAAGLAAAPIAWLLPFIGAGTALLFGAGVGLGTAAASRDLVRRIGAG